MSTPPTTKIGKARRPRTAYNLFFQQARKIIQHEHFQETGKKATYVHLSRMVSTKWKNLSQQEKAFYEELAAKDRRRYALELIASATHREEPQETAPDHGQVRNEAPAQTEAEIESYSDPSGWSSRPFVFPLTAQTGQSASRRQERSLSQGPQPSLVLPMATASSPSYASGAGDLRRHLTRLLQHPQVPGLLLGLLNEQQQQVYQGTPFGPNSTPSALSQETNTFHSPPNVVVPDPIPIMHTIDESLESTFDEETMHRLEASLRNLRE